MSIEYVTNDIILRRIENLITDNKKSGGSLSVLESIDIGSQKTIKTSCHLSLFPMSQEIIRVYTGGEADIKRNYRFMVTVKKPNTLAATNLVNGLLNNIRILFNRNINKDLWRLGSKDKYPVYNTVISDIQLSEDKVLEDLTFSGHVDVSFLCKYEINSIPSYFDIKDSMKHEVNPKEISKTIVEILEKYAIGLGVKKVFLNSPVEEYPGISVFPGNSSLNRKFVGVNQLDNFFEVVLFTRDLSKDDVYNNLKLTDALLNILYINKGFSGRSYNTLFNGVQYGLIENNEEMVFVSSISIKTESFDQNIR